MNEANCLSPCRPLEEVQAREPGSGDEIVLTGYLCVLESLFHLLLSWTGDTG